MSAHDSGMPSHEEIHIGERSGWRKLPAVFGAVGLGGLALGFGTMGEHHADFYYSYLVSLMFWLAIGLGGLFFVAIQHGTRAGWSIVVRRLAENAMLTLPALAVLAIPVVFMGTHDLYHWTHVDDPTVANDPILQAKAGYLNEGSFHVRGVIYMLAWSGLSILLWTWSTKQDTARDPIPFTHKLRWMAPLSIMIFALSLTFGAFDWLMSLDPHWFSTIFGVYYFAGCVISIHAFLAITAILLHRSGYLRGVVTPEHFHDLGKMMFAFTVFWTYIAFSQFMLIWYASIPEETQWFQYRTEGQFGTLTLVLVFARFAIPFVGIMSRRFKRNPKTLFFWASWMLVAQVLDMYWLIKPVHAHETGDFNIHLGIADFATFIGIGGVTLAVFTWATCKNALVPAKDPRLLESINHENA